MEVWCRARTVRHHVVLQQADPAGRHRPGGDHAEGTRLSVADQRVLGQGADVDQRGVQMRHAGHPGSPPLRRAAPAARRDLPHAERISRVTVRNTGPTAPVVRHPMSVIGRGEPDSDGALGIPGPAGLTPGREQRIAAVTLGLLLVIGGLIGTINLFVADVLPAGPQRWIYAATMAACLLAAVPLVLRRRVTRPHIFGLVLLADLIYLVVVFCIDDPVRYAPPLMLLFPSMVAAWFLGRWELAVNMVVTTVVCLIALWPSYDNALGLAVQVGVSAGMLNAGALGVFLLRRRVERLLAATQMLSHLDPLTGVFDRRFLVAQAPRMWRQARRDGIRVAAMMLDLDHFKRLNDAHGHAAGDAVLRAVSTSLAATVRPTDVLARTGGEDWSCSVSSATRRGGAARRAPADRRGQQPHGRRPRGHRLDRHRADPAGGRRGRGRRAVAPRRPRRRRDVRGQAAGPRPGGLDVGAPGPDAAARCDLQPTGAGLHRRRLTRRTSLPPTARTLAAGPYREA